MDELFATFDRELRRYLAMGQIVDATLVSAPKQRNSDDEKQAIKAGRRAAELSISRPKRRRRTRKRWTVKTGRRREPTGTQDASRIGYKSHIAIDRAYGFSSAVTDASCQDVRRLSDNLAAGVWADTAYRRGPKHGSRAGYPTSIARPPGRVIANGCTRRTIAWA